MKVAIMTDTNSGILPYEGAEKGIYVLPMPFIVDGENYLYGTYTDRDKANDVAGQVGYERDIDTWVEEIKQ